MRSSGNSPSGGAHRRLELALRSGTPDRVLECAREVEDLALDDVLQIVAFLIRAGDPRGDRAAARFIGRVLITGRYGLEDADAVLSLVERLPSDDALAELRRYTAG